MTSIVKLVLLIVNILCLVITVLFGIFGIYEQIMGPANAERLLRRIHFPLNYNQTLIMFFVCLVVLIVTYIIRMNLSGKM
jgi:hypothetical protein